MATVSTEGNKCEANGSQLKPWLFQPGQSGNPAGRPLGARNRLAETFLEDAYAAWLEYGAQAMETMAKDDPSAFVKTIAALMPREATLNLGIGDQLAAMLERMQGDGPEPSPIVDITPDGDAVVTCNDDDRQSYNSINEIDDSDS